MHYEVGGGGKLCDVSTGFRQSSIPIGMVAIGLESHKVQWLTHSELLAISGVSCRHAVDMFTSDVSMFVSNVYSIVCELGLKTPLEKSSL